LLNNPIDASNLARSQAKKRLILYYKPMEYWPRKKYGCRPPCYDYKKNLKGIKRSCDEGIGSMTSKKKKNQMCLIVQYQNIWCKISFQKV
jgi:hypothetical protein